MATHANGKPAKLDVVWIRKSTDSQDEGGQSANVRNMLAELGTDVPKDRWFAGTVSRRKVKANAGFNRLMDMVQAGKVATVYVESQDRWGTADRAELFTLLGILRQHNTCLYDLRAKRDLTERDLSTELLAFVNSIKSEKELQDIAYRSLRSRVNNFKASGSWPTGTHPFGYGKACYSPDGRLLWVWQPVSRSLGQLYVGEALAAGPADIAIPRKDKLERVVLVPSNNPEYVESVRLIFDLYTRAALSRRQIAMRLNQQGRRFYSRPFSHTYVTQILTNPAYAGDTHFGKTQTGEMYTFDEKGLLVELKQSEGIRTRQTSERLIKQDTHEPLVSRQTWQAAQAKLAAEQERTSFAPRNPAYYLKQLLVCGHCGSNMSGRTEIDPSTKERRVVYVCQSWMLGHSKGVKTACGHHRITHAEAERMLFDKIAELNLRFDGSASEQARVSVQRQMARLSDDEAKSDEQWQSMLKEGLDAFADYLGQTYPDLDYRQFKRLKMRAMRHYCEEAMADIRQAVLDAEQQAVEHARCQLGALEQEHAAYTRNWAKATEAMQAVIKADIDRLEGEMALLRPQTESLTTRLKSLYDAEVVRQDERRKLAAEWPALESREKGEALRRLFSKVTLYWRAQFRKAEAKPSRPRKTDRPGRYSYTLERDRIRWDVASADLASSW